MPTNNWNDFGQTFGAANAVMYYRELMKLWRACKQAQWAIDGLEFPPTSDDLVDRGMTASISGGVATLTNPDGTAASLTSANFGDPDIPGGRDLIVNYSGYDPTAVSRYRIGGVHGTTPSDQLDVTWVSGPVDPSGPCAVIFSSGLWWNERWPDWPGKAGAGTGGFDWLRWYSGAMGESYKTVDADGSVTTTAFASGSVDYSIPDGSGACVSTSAAVFPGDAEEGNIDVNSGSDNFCDTDIWLNPDLYKCIRGVQWYLENRARRFVADKGPGGYDDYADYVIDTLRAAMVLPNAWTATSGIPSSGTGYLPVGGPGVTLPADWPVDGSHHRTVHYAIVCNGTPVEQKRSSGTVLASGTVDYDGNYLLGDFGDVIGSGTDGTHYKFKGQKVYLSFGWSRRVPRRFRYLYAETRRVQNLDPDTGDGDGTYNWVTRPASTRHAEYGELGILADNPDSPFATGELAAYLGDNFRDPCLRAWPDDQVVGGDSTDPRLPDWATFVTRWRGKPNGYTPQPDMRPVESGTVTAAAAGTITDSSKSWDVDTKQDMWAARDIVLVDPSDGSTHRGTITGNDASSLTYTGATTADVGWQFLILEWQPGAVLRWDGSKWVRPTGDGLPPDTQCIHPTTVDRFGKWHKGDFFGPYLLAELRAVKDQYTATMRTPSWEAHNSTGAADSPNAHGGADTDTERDHTWAEIQDIVANDISTGWNHRSDGLDVGPPKAQYNAHYAPLQWEPPGETPDYSSFAEAFKRWAYAYVNQIPTVLACSKEFYGFATIAEADPDPGVTWDPPQVDTTGTNLANYYYTPAPLHGEPSVYERFKLDAAYDAGGVTKAGGGSALAMRKWNLLDTKGPSKVDEQYSAKIGDDSGLPAACAEPTVEQVGLVPDPALPTENADRMTDGTSVSGYYIYNQVVILRWNFPDDGGMTYV